MSKEVKEIPQNDTTPEPPSQPVRPEQNQTIIYTTETNSSDQDLVMGTALLLVIVLLLVIGILIVLPLCLVCFALCFCPQTFKEKFLPNQRKKVEHRPSGAYD